MPTYTDYGIVLNSYNLSEADKIFNIYTKQSGLVRAVAKGIKKSKGQFTGKIDQLSCLFFQLARGKNLDTICEVEEINRFKDLRKEPLRLFTAILFLEVVNNFAQEGEIESVETYNLLYDALNELQTTKEIELLTLKFIFNFISLHGFKPQFESCVSCSKTVYTRNDSNGNLPFSCTLGGLLCKECLQVEHKVISLSIINLLKDLEKGRLQSKENNEDIRTALKLLKEHLNTRAKKEIKSFDIVFSL